MTGISNDNNSGKGVTTDHKSKTVVITGGTGYMGSRLILKLIQRGWHVIALVREGSAHKVPAGGAVFVCNLFDAATFQNYIPQDSVFVQLLGVPHPSPAKAKLFTTTDLKSVKASVDAAVYAGVSHFVYVSVSMADTKMMKAYQDVRKEGEAYILEHKLCCSFIRPWYVLGPGHWWPLLLLPFYGIAEMVPAWRQKARSMTLVTIRQMINALLQAVEATPTTMHKLEIKDIRLARRK